MRVNKYKKSFLIVIILITISLMSVTSCMSSFIRTYDKKVNNVENEKIDSWDPKSYTSLDEIISIEEVSTDDIEQLKGLCNTYRIKYKSDDCEVISYLSIPRECLKNKKTYPCVIFNRGGNREYGKNSAGEIAFYAESFNMIIFASQYRGVDGGTGREEFGGADLNDVLKLIDLCSKFSFVDMNKLYMIGGSRGGMMTYMAVREDNRIKKSIVVSGIADVFMDYEYSDETMRKEVYEDLIGGTPEEMAEEYKRRSATYWADEIKCPVLIIHSKQDKKVSYAEAEKMAESLEKAGKEYKLITYDDDFHGFHEEDLNVILDWFRN